MAVGSSTIGTNINNHGRKRLRVSESVPRSVQEQAAQDRELNFQKRTKAADNMTWMRTDWSGCDWDDKEDARLRSMLGLDDINPSDRPVSDVYTWSPNEDRSVVRG